MEDLKAKVGISKSIREAGLSEGKYYAPVDKWLNKPLITCIRVLIREIGKELESAVV